MPTCRLQPILLLACVLICLAFGSGVAAQSTKGPDALDERKVTLEEGRLVLERERLSFEKEKYKRDHKLERRKVYVTGLSVAVPLLAAASAYAVQLWARKRDETLQFQLKAAEIVMDVRDTNQARRKAELLTQLFPARLSALKATLDQDSLPYFGPSLERREEFFRLLAQYPGNRADLIRAWEILFPWDSSAKGGESSSVRSQYKWFDELKKDATLNKNQQPPAASGV